LAPIPIAPKIEEDYPTLPMSPVQIQTGTQRGRNSMGFTDAEARVWNYLEANPDAIELSVRKLANATDINKTTAASVLAKYKASKGARVD